MRVEDRDRFSEGGVVRVERLVAEGVLARARELLWEQLERKGVRVRGKWRRLRAEGVPATQVGTSLAREVGSHAPFDALMTEAVAAHVARCAGGRRLVAADRVALLVTPPGSGPWTLPHLGWHVDASSRDGRFAGVQAFVLVDEVARGGGATVALAGSHRLPGSTGVAHRLVREHAFFGRLFDPLAPDRDQLLQAHPLDGVSLQVIEMVGRPGDVYFMDMRVLHAPSINATTRARLCGTRRHLPA